MPRLKLDDLPTDTADLHNIQAHLRPYGSVDRYLASVQDYLPALTLAQPQQQGTAANQITHAVLQQGASLPRKAHVALLQQLKPQIPAPISGAALLAAIDATRLLPFGLDSIDNLLTGGMRETTITELSGETCSGKTQLCHLAAVTTAQRGERVMYFDTTNGFNAARAAQMYQVIYNSTASFNALHNITVIRCHSIHALLTSLDELAQQASSSAPGSWPRMIIVDSISALLSPVIGSTQHHQGHVLVAETGRLLRHIADSLKLAVLVTNHVVGAGSYGRSGGREDAGGAPSSSVSTRLGPGDINYNYKPALGQQWRGIPHVRVQLSRAPAADVVCATLLTHAMKEVGQQAWLHVGELIQDAKPPR